MNIAIIAPKVNLESWINVFSKYSQDINLHIWPDIKDKSSIDCICLWKHPEGILKSFKNLKLIHSMGAGVDHILRDKSLPDHIPICRISDEKLSFSMSNYIIMAVLFYHRRILKYQDDKLNKIWDSKTHPEIPVKIGILGYGYLGSDAGKKLKNLGFEVIGYSLRKKTNKNVEHYHGDDLKIFLSKINVLVCTVPYTNKTENLLSQDLFEMLNDGTYLINVSRGKVQNEKDILRYIKNGKLSGAFLDVFENEPLPNKSEIWNEKRIQITPHNASITNEEAAVPQIIDNLCKVIEGRKLENQVNLNEGY